MTSDHHNYFKFLNDFRFIIAAYMPPNVTLIYASMSRPFSASAPKA